MLIAYLTEGQACVEYAFNFYSNALVGLNLMLVDSDSDTWEYP